MARKDFTRFSSIFTIAIPLFLIFTIAVAPSSVWAQTTIRVPADQTTIQAAIDVATNGSTILVSDGTYKERIDFKGKLITVKSVNGPAVTTIDGGGGGTVVTLRTNEGPTSILNGFTITNGAAATDASSSGGGIFIGNASPTISNNIIKSNKGCNGGFGIFVGGGGSSLIQGNTISNNTQVSNCFGGVGGGGIAVQGQSTTRIIGNVIANNVADVGGAITLFASGALIQNNIMTHNDGGTQGGGIWMVNEAPAQIIQNLIIHNKGTQGGGIFTSASGSGILLLNNTIADNPGTEGSGLYGGFPADAVIQNNLIVGVAGSSAIDCDFGTLPPAANVIDNTAFTTGAPPIDSSCPVNPLGSGGNISSDPLFVDPANDNFRLQPNSPAVDSGNNTTPVPVLATDLSGNNRVINSTVDMGAFEFSPAVDFTVNPQQGVTTSVTIPAGQTAIYNLAVHGEASSFSANVNLTCSGAPAGALCMVSPASITLNGTTPANFTVSVTTAARSSSLPSIPAGSTGMPLYFLMLSLFGLGMLATSALLHKRRFYAGVTVVLLGGLLLLAGCGGGGGSTSGSPKPPPGGGTPAGTSTITVTAASGSATRTLNLTLTVQ